MGVCRCDRHGQRLAATRLDSHCRVGEHQLFHQDRCHLQGDAIGDSRVLVGSCGDLHRSGREGRHLAVRIYCCYSGITAGPIDLVEGRIGRGKHCLQLQCAAGTHRRIAGNLQSGKGSLYDADSKIQFRAIVGCGSFYLHRSRRARIHLHSRNGSGGGKFCCQRAHDPVFRLPGIAIPAGRLGGVHRPEHFAAGGLPGQGRRKADGIIRGGVQGHTIRHGAGLDFLAFAQKAVGHSHAAGCHGLAYGHLYGVRDAAYSGGDSCNARLASLHHAALIHTGDRRIAGGIRDMVPAEQRVLRRDGLLQPLPFPHTERHRFL